jgi:hypothetical protein
MQRPAPDRAVLNLLRAAARAQAVRVTVSATKKKRAEARLFSSIF